MLTESDAWPRRYPIGKPTASDLQTRPAEMREHATRWQSIRVGSVTWQEINYRASAEAIRMPTHWVFERPSDWIRGADDRQMDRDFALLEVLIMQSEPELHATIISRLRLLQNRSQEELVSAIRLAERLGPGEAQGRPLRLLAGHGIDTKFFERNRQLLIRLLDARFDGEATEQGLHHFLGAAPDGDHWLLVAPLRPGVLPFAQQQVRTRELATLAVSAMPGTHILVVENRQCLHLLPPLGNTIAILGAGLDLDWLSSGWLAGKQVGYWGDIDTWGLTMLARARELCPALTALLMDKATFEQHGTGNAVAEPVIASDLPPSGLAEQERELYAELVSSERGRLEQEFLSPDTVRRALVAWHRATTTSEA